MGHEAIGAMGPTSLFGPQASAQTIDGFAI
jgi:hypothetical protein